ncbi:MAG: tRNA (adenosine(37)-N6)-dimethylallyltransferase MiaA, partial [Vitreoscilla sp.]|nr:tRNA (adenosine(37)-N6)-dimethylallyltransferase MiaA [Vitreoscilla sp.]
MSHPRAFAILGPTASGKTRLALSVATVLPIEIISLDSA